MKDGMNWNNAAAHGDNFDDISATGTLLLWRILISCNGWTETNQVEPKFYVVHLIR